MLRRKAALKATVKTKQNSLAEAESRVPLQMVRLISVHTPKCAGSSFAKMLQSHYGADRVLLDYSDRPANPASPLYLDPIGHRRRVQRGLQDLASFDVVHGHFHPDKYAALSDARRITILRHPIDRLFSHYYYWQSLPKHGHSLHDYFLDNQLSVLQFACLPMIRYIYTRVFFLGVQLDQFDFVGIFERLDDDLIKLGRLLDRDFQLPELNRNTSATQQAELAENRADPKLIRKLEILLRDDIRFYRKFL